LNGLERFSIELMRVNMSYKLSGFQLTQAEIIALSLIFIGLILMLFAPKLNKIYKD
jgi:prolipoprotein diacylglyceryltransferase